MFEVVRKGISRLQIKHWMNVKRIYESEISEDESSEAKIRKYKQKRNLDEMVTIEGIFIGLSEWIEMVGWVRAIISEVMDSISRVLRFLVLMRLRVFPLPTMASLVDFPERTW